MYLYGCEWYEKQTPPICSSHNYLKSMELFSGEQLRTLTTNVI